MDGDLDPDDQQAVGRALNGDDPVGRVVREARERGPRAVLDALVEGVSWRGCVRPGRRRDAAPAA